MHCPVPAPSPALLCPPLPQDIISQEFAKQLQAATSDGHVSDLTAYGGPWNPLAHNLTLPEDHGTSHFCVADAAGNAVSLTATVNTVFGSGVVSESTGGCWPLAWLGPWLAGALLLWPLHCSKHGTMQGARSTECSHAGLRA